MISFIKKRSLTLSAAVTVGLMSGADSALAAGVGSTGRGNDFSSIAQRIVESISGIPGLLTGVAYLIGILLGVLGILKIKDHVENPSSEKLSHGAIRLAAGGALFALPMVYEAMQNTIGDGAGVSPAVLSAIPFEVQ